MRFTDVAANAPKPFIYFAKADSGLKDADVSGMRVRLARELKGIVGYMSKCDLEKNNEPVVVLFTQLEPEVSREVWPPFSAESVQPCHHGAFAISSSSLEWMCATH